MQSKLSSSLVLAMLATGLAGVSGQVAAQEFTISANVTNAVSITQNTALNFGTLFATVTGVGGDGTFSQVVTLAPNGTVTPETAVASAPAVVYLGSATAGNYTIPGLPINSKVYITLQDSNGEAITNTTTVASMECSYADAAAAIADKRIVLTAGGPGNGNFSGFFCVDGFVASIGGTPSAVLLDPAGTGYTVPGASLGNVTFTLGASVVPQAVPTGDAAEFEQAAYSGVFNMEVGFK